MLIYYVYQVSLNFINDGYVIFGTKDYDNVNIKCPNESLKMNIEFNSGTGDDYHGWCDIVCKGNVGNNFRSWK